MEQAHHPLEQACGYSASADTWLPLMLSLEQSPILLASDAWIVLGQLKTRLPTRRREAPAFTGAE